MQQTMTMEEFGQSIKAKYPQYNSVPNVELAEKIINKYPVYKNQIKEQKSKSFIESAGEFAGGMARAAAQPFAETAGTGLAALKGGYQYARGIAADPIGYTKAFFGTGKTSELSPESQRRFALAQEAVEKQNIPLYGEVKPISIEEPARVAGTGAQLASLFMGAPQAAAAGRAGVGAKGLLSPVIKEAAKREAVAGTIGGLGAGIADKDATAASVIGSTLFGTALGAGTGVVSPLIGRGIGRIFGKGKTEKTLQEGAKAVEEYTGGALKKIQQKAAREFDDALGLTAPQARAQQRRIFQSTKQGQKPPDTVGTFLVKEGIPLKAKENNGRLEFDTTDTIRLVNDKESVVNSELEKVLMSKPEKNISVNELREETLKKLKTEVSGMNATEMKQMEAGVNRHFDDEIDLYGEFVNGVEANAIKKGFANSGGANKLYKDLTPTELFMRKSANTVKTAIENEYRDVSQVKDLNRVLGQFIEAKDLLQKKHGSVVRGGKLSKDLAGVVGATAGVSSRIPVVGPLLGKEFAERAHQWAINPARRTSKAIKEYADVSRLKGELSPSEGVLRKSQATRASAQSRFLTNQQKQQEAVRRFGTTKTPLLESPQAMTSRRLSRGAQVNVGPTGVAEVSPQQPRRLFEPRKSNIAPNNVMGIGAGIEPELDENGQPTGRFKFDAAKAAIGFAGMTAAQKTGLTKMLQENLSKFLKKGKRVLPEDRAKLLKYTDYVASGDYKIAAKRDHNLEADITDILGKYSDKLPKTQNKMSELAGDLLDVDSQIEMSIKETPIKSQSGNKYDQIIRNKLNKSVSLQDFVRAKKISEIKTGEPIIVSGYHGTPDARFLEEFDPMKKGYYKDAPEALPDMSDWIETYGKHGQGFKQGQGVFTGISFSDDARVAKSYTEKPVWDNQNAVPMVVERKIVLKNPKVIDVKDKKHWNVHLEEEVAKAKEEGHDGIVFKGIMDNYHPSETIEPSNNVVVFDVDSIKTNSQLENIWKESKSYKDLLQRL